MSSLIDRLENPEFSIGSTPFPKELDAEFAEKVLAENHTRRILEGSGVSLHGELKNSLNYRYSYPYEGKRIQVGVTSTDPTSMISVTYHFVGIYDGLPLVGQIALAGLREVAQTVETAMRPINEIYSRRVPLILFTVQPKVARDAALEVLMKKYNETYIVQIANKREFEKLIKKRHLRPN